jgi:hypothetical protein
VLGETAKLSVFWTNEALPLAGSLSSTGSFLDNALVLLERERVRPPRPTLAQVRVYLAEAPFASWACSARFRYRFGRARSNAAAKAPMSIGSFAREPR